MKVHKIGNNYYLAKRSRKHPFLKDLLFRVYACQNTGGKIQLTDVYLPEELLGKKFRLRLEFDNEM